MESWQDLFSSRSESAGDELGDTILSSGLVEAEMAAFWRED